MGGAILIIEDETRLAKNIRAYLELNGFTAQVTGSAEEGLGLLGKLTPDGVLLDFQLPGMNGLEVVARIREVDPRIKTIMMTGYGSIELAVEAMRAGAYDFLTKPLSLAKLKLLLDRAIGDEQRDRTPSSSQEREARGVGGLLGESEGVRALRRRIEQVLEAEGYLVQSDLPAVLITGETGTGKELVAHALHYGGSRAAGPFVKLNCAALPAQLVESELFGHERGAFTDARARKQGLLEAADGGTMFLDEVAELELGAQAKLLRVLDEKVARRLGSVRDYQTNARIIAATNRALESELQEGRFRADLYFRLRILELHVPPLRERNGDVLLLARHFLGVHGARYGKPGLRMSEEAERMLLGHRWPGNVRELRNVIEQVVLLARHDVIRPDDLSLCTVMGLPPEERVATADCCACADFPCAGLKLGDVERDLLLKALRQTSWNVSRAARLLGISRDTLRYRMEKFELAQDT
jgi:DNA-binding NtrC family response regulator